jgi:class 3 adenylate cyclase
VAASEDPEGAHRVALEAPVRLAVRVGAVLLALELVDVVGIGVWLGRLSWPSGAALAVAVLALVAVGIVIISFSFEELYRPVRVETATALGGGGVGTAKSWALEPRVLAGACAAAWPSGMITALVVTHFDTAQSRFPAAMLTSLVVAGVLCFGYFKFLQLGPVLRPIAALTEGVRRVQQGDLGSRLLVTSSDELGELVSAFNEMVQGLEEREALRAEIAALNRLRRFLSPQVAEAVLTAGDEAVLQPHRRKIAVFFCDLRGFTNFASGAEPEEIVEALDAYYEVVGGVIRGHDATVGTFAGDGIMAYLNDPLPCDDPPWTAIQMASELRGPMEEFQSEWARKGFQLGYGTGIAYGYATLGTIGFEGRNDYTAVGSVVNLAARLCGEAAPGEVLIDSKAADALDRRVAVAAREVTLKGFPSPITAFQVVD